MNENVLGVYLCEACRVEHQMDYICPRRKLDLSVNNVPIELKVTGLHGLTVGLQAGELQNSIRMFSNLNHANFNKAEEVARIGPDGIMRFMIDANDENAKKFVECIEVYLKTRLTGLEVEHK